MTRRASAVVALLVAVALALGILVGTNLARPSTFGGQQEWLGPGHPFGPGQRLTSRRSVDGP